LEEIQLYEVRNGTKILNIKLKFKIDFINRKITKHNLNKGTLKPSWMFVLNNFIL